MPSMDRRWWALILISTLWALLPIWFVLGDWSTGSTLIESPLLALGQIKLGNLVGSSPAAFFGWWLWTTARGGKKREHLRALALAGDHDAMLPARVPPHPDPVPDMTHGPIMLLWRTRRGPSGVLATADGLVWRRPRTPDLLLRWTDARLFEIWNLPIPDKTLAGYSLYDGTGHFIEWQEYREGKAPPPAGGVPIEEIRRRERALFALILARTGLQPRTFSLDLADLAGLLGSLPTTAERPHGLRRLSLRATLYRLALVGAPLAVAVGALILPLTRSFVLNAYVAATIGGLGLIMLPFAIKAFARDMRDLPPSLTPIVTLPTARPEWIASLPQERLVVSKSFRSRAEAAVIGLLLAGDGFAAIRAVMDYPFAGNPALTSPDLPRNLVFWALAFIVIIGVAVCGFVAIGSVAYIVADDIGLHRYNGKVPVTLSWNDIAQLVAITSSGKIDSYRVRDAGAEAIEISWGADWLWRPRPAWQSERDAAELAAIVAQRTGLSLTVVGD